MTLIKDIDTYIISTGKLLKTIPSATISVSYTHTKSGKSLMKFKSYDPKHGICYTFSTRKQKEFSKLCNALGPRGCSIGSSEIEGLSLLLMNTQKDEVVPIEEPTTIAADPVASSKPQEATPTPEQNTSSSKNKKKKKGKKH